MVDLEKLRTGRSSKDTAFKVDAPISAEERAHRTMQAVLIQSDPLSKSNNADRFLLNNHASGINPGATDGAPPGEGNYSYALMLRPTIPTYFSVISLEVFSMEESLDKTERLERAKGMGEFVLREGTLNVSKLGGVIEKGQGAVLDTDLAIKAILQQHYGLPITIQVDSDLSPQVA